MYLLRFLLQQCSTTFHIACCEMLCHVTVTSKVARVTSCHVMLSCCHAVMPCAASDFDTLVGCDVM